MSALISSTRLSLPQRRVIEKRMAQQSNFSVLCRGRLVPKEIEDKEAVIKFMEAVDQFERIINDTPAPSSGAYDGG